MKRITLLSLVISLFIVSCQIDSGKEKTEEQLFKIETEYGDMVFKLYDATPLHKENFIKLIEQGYFDDLLFHRVIDGFMIQGGDPNTKTELVATYGTGGPGYTIEDEHIKADILSNRRGTIAMANNGQPNSGGSQFFINLVDNQRLDFDKAPLTSKHPVFGQVIAGMEVVDAIARVETNSSHLPLEDIMIESVTIER
jgi:peptidylprolyl isomerase